MSLCWDWETRSDVDLIKCGAYRYVESPYTDALLASHKLNATPEEMSSRPVRAWLAAGGEVGKLYRWVKGEPCPPWVRAYVEAGGEIKAHNAAFERLIWWFIMAARHGWPKPRLEQFRCTATTAAAMSLPRSLDRLGAALDLDVKKDKKGKALIKRHSIPQGWKDGAPVWDETPESLADFALYCDGDVLTEEEADERLVPLSDDEQAVYVLSETINDRGIRIDVRSARAALSMIEQAKHRINKELTAVTGGYVTACTQAAALKRWLEMQGVVMASMDKDDIEEMLFDVDDLPDNVRRALELRQEGAKPSVEKIASMLDRVCADGRARGVYLHHGAGQTGRFSSRGLQAHNMPKYRKEFEAAKPRLSTLFQAIRTASPEWIEFVYGPKLGRPLHILSDAVRSFIWAAPGHDLIDADYSSIEGRMAAWFSGEEWKLEAYRQLDSGTGQGIYELAAASIYNIDVKDVDRAKRSVGKVSELALGYGGGAGALAKMARQNKLKLHTVFGPVWESAGEERQEAAAERYEERVRKHDGVAERLGRDGWLAAELIKVGWRAAHPAITTAWKLLEDAVTAAVENPGLIASSLGVRYRVAHDFLWCFLPSGRCLAYGCPLLQEVEAPWADKTLPKEERETKKSVTVLGVDSQTEKWIRFSVYGGSLFNNVVQGSARDILVNGIRKAEAASYPVVLHTHDELASEVPIGWGNVGEYERLICELPPWAAGLPLTASGWRGKRYRKD